VALLFPCTANSCQVCAATFSITWTTLFSTSFIWVPFGLTITANVASFYSLCSICFQMLQSLLFKHKLSECINMLVVGGSKIGFWHMIITLFKTLLIEVGNVSIQMQELWYMTPKCKHIGSDIFCLEQLQKILSPFLDVLLIPLNLIS